MQYRTQNAVYQLRTFLLGDILQPVVHRKFNTMKKLLLALFSFYGLSVASAASEGKADDFTQSANGTITLDDISPAFNSGTFAFSFDLEKVLAYTGNLDFQFSYGDGTNSGAVLSFSYAQGFLALGSSLGGGYTVFDASADLLIFQVNDLFGPAPTASISAYYSAGSVLSPQWSGSITAAQPTKITTATTKLTSVGGGSIAPAEEVGFTAWQGEVTAEEVANPSAVPTLPSVPEPATATLSLLALCGLAARRRR